MGRLGVNFPKNAKFQKWGLVQISENGFAEGARGIEEPNFRGTPSPRRGGTGAPRRPLYRPEYLEQLNSDVPGLVGGR